MLRIWRSVNHVCTAKEFESVTYLFTRICSFLNSFQTCLEIGYVVAMTLDCFCGRNDANQRNLFTVKVQLLDNTISEYSLNKKSTGLDCLKRIAQEVNLKEVSVEP